MLMVKNFSATIPNWLRKISTAELIESIQVFDDMKRTGKIHAQLMMAAAHARSILS